MIALLNADAALADKDEWETPSWLFDMLDREFAFTLDAAATAQNARCEKYYTKADDALAQTWSGSVWCNPPYSRALLARFIEKGLREARLHGGPVVMLIPASTSSQYWHDWVMMAAEVRFVCGRLRFLYHGSAVRCNAPFSNAVVVFSGGRQGSAPALGAIYRPAADASRIGGEP